MKSGLSGPEALHGPGLILENVEDGDQLGDLKKVVDFLRQIQQLKLPALSRNAGKGTHQLTDSSAVDVADVAEIQQDTFGNYIPK